MIYSVLESTMRTALDNVENINDDGSTNWNFVDADCYMDCKNLFRSDADFYEAFESIATKIQKERKALKDEAIQLEMEV